MTDEQVPRTPGVMCGDDVSRRLGRSKNPDIGIRALAEAPGDELWCLRTFAPDHATINWRASLATCGPTVCLLLIVGPLLQQTSRARYAVGRDEPATA